MSKKGKRKYNSKKAARTRLANELKKEMGKHPLASVTTREMKEAFLFLSTGPALSPIMRGFNAKLRNALAKGG